MNIHTDHHAFTSTSIKVTRTPTQSSVRPMLVRFARTLSTAALTVVLAACGSSSDVATPALSAPSLADISSRTLAKDALAEALVFTNTGGAPQAGAGGCTATGLPAGLVVGPTANGNSCMITGTPITANQNAVTVTVTAVNTAGNSVATVVLTVSDGQPIVDATSPVIANIVVEQTYVSGAVIAPITFTNTGLAVKATDGCIVSPALPASLGVAVFTDNGKMTCQITGTPAATAARKTYIVTATSDNNGTNTASVSIEIVQTSPSLYTQVAVGASNACAINTVGELYCWGRGDSGRLGLGDTNDRAAPTRVGTATNWSQVNTSNHTCAINTARELYCWGKGDIGQLGLSDTNDRNTPTRVGTATNWSQVNAGNRH
ncbi:MAG: putative Ig domain-containing protein, partial [Gammaproteobacteria bacterium]|nr:putative Ig domain-containing protein [Gammaproteobacteria bacterium]